MIRRRSNWLSLFAISMGLAVATSASYAQEAYPSRAIKLIVPYAAGGSTDATARLFAHELSSSLKQTVIVENRPGANGLIGTESAARADGDGYTLLFGPIATNAIAGSLYPDIRYDPINDFVAISEVARTPLLLVVGPSVPVKTLSELRSYVKNSAREITYASGGQGTASHIAGALFVRQEGFAAQHIPYKGSGLALNDVMGGHVDLMFDSIATSLQQVRAGKLHALGISTKSRSDIAPEIPTLEEAGMPGFEVTWWFGLFAPRGTSPEIVETLSSASKTVLSRAAVRDEFITRGLEPVGSNAAEFGQKVKNEAIYWGRVIRDAGIKVQ